MRSAPVQKQRKFHDGGMRRPIAPSTIWNAGVVLMALIGVVHYLINR